jgi:hypothetical protein
MVESPVPVYLLPLVEVKLHYLALALQGSGQTSALRPENVRLKEWKETMGWGTPESG